MTRNGKIARLPREIRDELNRRLDDGEQNARLVKWLNGLPEVRRVLESDFGGRPVNEVNLADWKNGGFLDWQARQEALTLIQDLKTSGEELTQVTAAELTEPLTAAVIAQYAAAVYRSNADKTEEPMARVRRLGKSLRDLDRLRRREQARERIEIQREWLELERQKCREAKTSETEEQPMNNNEIQPMTEEEKTEMLRKLLMPKEDETPPDSSPHTGAG